MEKWNNSPVLLAATVHTSENKTKIYFEAFILWTSEHKQETHDDAKENNEKNVE